MPANKSQHYVPQFYMKLFADKDGKFNIYNVERRKEYNNIPYKGQCQKDYFYGKDLVFEKKFRDMETEWSSLFNKIINEEDLNEEDVRRIKQFAVYQSTRTVAALEHGAESKRIQMIEFMKMECANNSIPASLQQIEAFVEEKLKESNQDIPFPLHYSEECLSYVDDLNVVIMTYNTKETLISSDAPVVNVNKFIETHVGYAMAGFLSFFPICKNKIVAVYDARMYPRYRDRLYVESNDEKEVRILNEYQLINAETIIFSSRTDMDACYIAEVEELRNGNRNSPAVQAIGSSDSKLLAFKPRLSIYPCVLSFATLNRDARRVPQIGRDFLPRTKDDKYVERMEFRENTIPEIDKIHGNRSIEQQKEFRRAIRRMNRFAYRYWSRPAPTQVLKK